MQRIGGGRSERLDINPAGVRVTVTIRPEYACRACQEGVVQAPTPDHSITGGLPTDGMNASTQGRPAPPAGPKTWLVDKYANQLPLYHQTQTFLRQGIDLDRATLADH